MSQAFFSKTARRLKESGKTLSTAESCTGGLLGHRLTGTPQSSRYFMGGVIVYSDRAKTSLLGVSKGALKKNGAVSPQVAKEMAEKVRRKFRTDHGIGITGIAGPGGGSRNKPVGLVYIAAASAKKTAVKKFLFRGSRARVKSLSVRAALNLLLKEHL